MTTLSLLGGDWEYQFEDQTVGANAVAGTRMLKYNSGPVRTTNEVYSALAEAADEFQAMGFKNPMLPVTPNAYTMENKAFISRASTEWLKEGTINADWALVGVAGNNEGRGVLMVEYSGGTDFVSGDIGRQVTQAVTGDTGTLLDFEVLPDGTKVAWIRPDDSTPSTGDIFDGTGAISVTGDGGTGASTASVAGVSGESQITAIQAIGSVPTATEVYIIQDRIKLANSASNTGFQFWSTDPTVNLGIISVLIRTKLNGTDISAGDLEVFARRYTALYDNFRLNVSAGGFSALPLASAPDINNTTGYARVTTDAWTGSLTPVVGDILQEVGNTSQKLVVTAISGTGPNYTIDFYHTGDLGTFLDNDVIEDTGQTGTLTLSSNETATPGGPTDTSTGGGNITVTIGHQTEDFDNSGTAEPYSITVDCDSKATSIVYERLKYVTRRGQDNTFWNTVSCSIPGEQYRGLEALAYYDGAVGSLVQGEDINNETQTAQTMRVMAINSVPAGEDVSQAYVTLADLQPSTVTLANNDVLADTGSTDSVTVDTAGAGGAILTISSPKSSPLGTYTGTQIFGAQGVRFTSLGAGDSQNYILTDDLGTLRTPPNTISFTVTNTRAGDRILVARDTGTAGVIDKDQFGGSHATNNVQDDADFVCAGTVDSEVPPAAIIRVVENALLQEHRYYYSSRTTGAGGTFTLKSLSGGNTGTATAGSSATQLVDDGRNFVTEGAEVGMLVRNTFAGKTTHVWEITGFAQTGATANDTLLVRALYGPLDATQDWDTGDTFIVNRLIQTYDANDDVFDLILDYEEDTGTDGVPGDMSNTFVKAGGTFGTVVQVRQGKSILPFELNQDVGQNNVSVTAVRTPDTIAV